MELGSVLTQYAPPQAVLFISNRVNNTARTPNPQIPKTDWDPMREMMTLVLLRSGLPFCYIPHTSSL